MIFLVRNQPSWSILSPRLYLRVPHPRRGTGPRSRNELLLDERPRKDIASGMPAMPAAHCISGCYPTLFLHPEGLLQPEGEDQNN